jgi:hypothetical protein
MGQYSLPVGVHYKHVAANGLGLKQDLLCLVAYLHYRHSHEEHNNNGTGAGVHHPDWY